MSTCKYRNENIIDPKPAEIPKSFKNDECKILLDSFKHKIKV